MINARDPRDDQDVTKLPCRIGTGDCWVLADGYCDECGKATCASPSCAIEIERSGYLLCVYCLEAIEKAAAKEN